MTLITDLVLERRDEPDRTVVFDLPNGEQHVTATFTPPVGEDYWAYRVRVADGQAVIGFGKFGTIGIGFAVEDDDWNKNLPYTQDTHKIAKHIWCNRGPSLPDDVPSFDLVVKAIELIQAAAAADRSDR